jgi:MtN3 and saliva related transmembrane protein
MDVTEFIGHAGAIISSLTFVPQVYQIWKTKRVHDLNLYMILIVTFSTILWVVYGYLKNLWPVMLCNAFICALSVIMLLFKIRYRHHKDV